MVDVAGTGTLLQTQLYVKRRTEGAFECSGLKYSGVVVVMIWVILGEGRGGTRVVLVA